MAFIEIYCDECRQDLISNKKSINEHNKYIVLGGIWIAKEYREDFKNQFNVFQDENTYSWVLITDTDIAKGLADAREA